LRVSLFGLARLYHHLRGAKTYQHEDNEHFVLLFQMH
jgi:hypothetical protein